MTHRIEEDGYECKIPEVLAFREKYPMTLVERWFGDRSLIILECWNGGSFNPSLSPFPRQTTELFAVTCGKAIVESVGFGGLFHAPEGSLVPEMIIGLKQLGFVDLAEIVNRAIAIYTPDFPRDLDSRLKLMVSEDTQILLNSLDHEFYQAIEEIGNPTFEFALEQQLIAACQNYP